MSYDLSYGPICLNSLADRTPAPKPLQLTVDGKTSYFYPTGWTGRYVRVSDNFKGELAAQLVVGITEAHPLWKHLRMASLDAETAVKHLLAVATELAAVESMVPSPAEYGEGMP